MKGILVKKFGTFLGLCAFIGIIIGYTFVPASCQISPEQMKRLQAITVPATQLGLAVAQSQGYITPGDRITITQGVAIVTSDKTPEAKLFELTELGLKEALNKGLITNGSVITLDTPEKATIAPPDPLPASPLLPQPQ
jgi:hypothetical protein